MPANPNERTRRWLARSPCALRCWKLGAALEPGLQPDDRQVGICGRPAGAVDLYRDKYLEAKRHGLRRSEHRWFQRDAQWQDNLAVEFRNQPAIRSSQNAQTGTIPDRDGHVEWCNPTADPSIAATGSFVVTNQLAPTSASADFQITSPVTYSLTTSQSTYPVWAARRVDAHSHQPVQPVRRGECSIPPVSRSRRGAMPSGRRVRAQGLKPSEPKRWRRASRSRNPPPGTARRAGWVKRSITGGPSSYPVPRHQQARPRRFRSPRPSRPR